MTTSSMVKILFPAPTNECRDKWSAKKCVKKLNKEECDNPWVAENCQLTCDLCSPGKYNSITYYGIDNIEVLLSDTMKYVNASYIIFNLFRLEFPTILVECNASDDCPDGFGECVEGFCKSK